MTSELKEHIENCPIGYLKMNDEPAKLIYSKGSTADDFADWLDELDRLVGIDE